MKSNLWTFKHSYSIKKYIIDYKKYIILEFIKNIKIFRFGKNSLVWMFLRKEQNNLLKRH